MQNLINKIVQADCLEFIKKIPDNSIDLVLTDPPYNIDFSSYDNKTDRSGKKYHNTEKLQWDKKFDLKEISKVLFKEFDRIVKSSGSIVMFGPQNWAYYYYGPAIQNNFDLKAQIIWIKSNPVPQARRKNYLSAHENIAWFARYSKKCPFTFNFISQNEMRNVFTFPICQGDERTEHPTQKPLKLIEKLLNIHSNKNDVVLDPFLGSGTTAVACKLLNRNYIGIEISEKYCDIARRRLSIIPKSLF